MKIYVASSWRNEIYPEVVLALRGAGHEVYDFRNPDPSDTTNDGFRWSEIVPGATDAPTDAAVVRHMLGHPIAQRGYAFDKNALDWADMCIMVLPCGKSAHLEMGYAIGQGKRTIILVEDPMQPELMYLLADDQVSTIDGAVEYARFADLCASQSITGTVKCNRCLSTHDDAFTMAKWKMAHGEGKCLKVEPMVINESNFPTPA